jgi:hypothetical protein
MSAKKPKSSNRRRRNDERLDEGLKDTFPASDPVSLTQPSRRDGPIASKADKQTPRRSERT